MKLSILGIIPAIISFSSSPIKNSQPVKMMAEEQQREEKDVSIDKSTMLKTILVIAAIGMTSIAMFYILKDKKIIK